MCPVSGMAANAWDFFYVHACVNVFSCLQGPYKHRESAPKADWQENALPQQGVKLV